ncbi:hypothetical protein ACI0X8_004282, partial [Cronobacter sakazakii]
MKKLDQGSGAYQSQRQNIFSWSITVTERPSRPLLVHHSLMVAFPEAVRLAAFAVISASSALRASISARISLNAS